MPAVACPACRAPVLATPRDRLVACGCGCRFDPRTGTVEPEIVPPEVIDWRPEAPARAPLSVGPPPPVVQVHAHVHTERSLLGSAEGPLRVWLIVSTVTQVLGLLLLGAYVIAAVSSCARLSQLP